MNQLNFFENISATTPIRWAGRKTKLLKVNDYIPIHYGTFPVLTGNPQQFKEKVESSCDSKVHILKPGDEYK